MCHIWFSFFPYLIYVWGRGAVVERFCEYMAFRAYYESVGPKEEVPVQEFMERIPPEVALEL
jgi:transcription elongation factor B subunit 1